MIWDKKIFKANDIRGRYPAEISEDVVFEIACGVKSIFKKNVVVGYDARLSSPALYDAVLAGLRFQKNGKFKLKIVEAGMITTPMLYFLVNKLNASGGIMITASHNPKEYNGLKIVGKKAMPMSGKEIYKKF